MTLETRNSTLHDILSQTTPLSVARFQRHYEWTVKEMEQLLSDLAESLREARSERSNPGYYFLGSFIFHTPKGRNVQVVDGQQRLVSLSIVLAVARDLTQDPSAQKQIDSYLTIPANAISQAPATQRLNLHRGDDAFYKTHIVPVGATNGLPKERQDNESHERLRRNAMRARHWIGKELSEGERAAFIHHITSACRIVLMTVDDEDDAFRIFETVNNRGRPLHAEDILRVTLIEFATPSESKRAELLRKWDTVERRIGQKEMPQFIAQWRVRQLQGKHSNKPLHRAIVESYGSPDEALAFLDKELTTHADIFNEISSRHIKGLGNSPTKQAIDKHLRSLGLVDFDDWLPIAMLFIERHRHEPETLLERLRSLDRLTWLFFLKHDDVKIAQDRQQRFSEVLRHLLREPRFDAKACRLDLSANEKAEMRGFVQNRIDPRWAPLKPLLVRLEYALTRGRARTRLIGYTIEHVLPLNPEGDYWYQRFDKSKRVVTEFAERIGNLCLVTEELNRAMDNRPFPEKSELALEAEAHKDSVLAADLGNETDWTKDVIERRSRWLLNVFCNEFDVSVA